ncbi:response regulator transcription factor [Chelativorans sp. SCAU2101]|jgi:Response regulator containing a CheY-like receiver domain and an HTH DNA-binding domain|uniref:Response regulator transcription factor n=1 Tax=Chelativorans petroleitrophicus TaxID=2975484 RepID=A0A9X2X8F7_9HYPH|nr:response regulator transcription factor [Chelativorans petroleitrophicus]MCT8990309.1 response regulator transcription factor [Chelativorans petroleitrophicus]
MQSALRTSENSVEIGIHAGSINGEHRGENFLTIPDAKVAGKSLLILDARALERECFSQSLASHGIGMKVLAFSSIESWKLEEDLHPPLAAIVVNIGSRKVTDPDMADELVKLKSQARNVPIVLLAENDAIAQVLAALEHGVRGYIPSSVSIDVCVEAINLAIAGGTFVPASSVLAARKLVSSSAEASRPMAGMFTERQEEVVRALRLGKANKIIAYELNLRESTVKVHIRNIMKKLKATNRTEVAYKISKMFPLEDGMQE